MPISLYKIKKWTKMLSGNSVFHVNQDEGKVYSKTELKGYYNNLTEKITRFGLSDYSVPKYYVDTGEEIYFSISIFQYGLAAYDLYLLNNDESMLGKVKACADWAVENQQEDGSWVTFAYETPEHPYSSMAQGEAIPLLVRAHLVFGEEKYLESAKKSRAFMLRPVDDGGTTKYEHGGIVLYECTHDPLVLNGWIFSAWGLLDYAKAFGDDESWKLWHNTVETMASVLPEFDHKYWSYYMYKDKIASPFYHKLHIAQLQVMYDLTGIEVFKTYADKFQRYQDSWWRRKLAFCVKAAQKIVN